MTVDKDYIIKGTLIHLSEAITYTKAKDIARKALIEWGDKRKVWLVRIQHQKDYNKDFDGVILKTTAVFRKLK